MRWSPNHQRSSPWNQPRNRGIPIQQAHHRNSGSTRANPKDVSDHIVLPTTTPGLNARRPQAHRGDPPGLSAANYRVLRGCSRWPPAYEEPTNHRSSTDMDTDALGRTRRDRGVSGAAGFPERGRSLTQIFNTVPPIESPDFSTQCPSGARTGRQRVWRNPHWHPLSQCHLPRIGRRIRSTQARRRFFRGGPDPGQETRRTGARRGGRYSWEAPQRPGQATDRGQGDNLFEIAKAGGQPAQSS